MCWPNMALHLNGLKTKQGLMDLRDIKTKNVVLGLIFMSKTVFERRGGEKEEKI